MGTVGKYLEGISARVKSIWEQGLSLLLSVEVPALGLVAVTGVRHKGKHSVLSRAGLCSTDESGLVGASLLQFCPAQTCSGS